MRLKATNILFKETTEIYHTSTRMRDLLFLMIQGASWHAWIIKAAQKGGSHCSYGHNILSAVSAWTSPRPLLNPLTKVILSSKDIYVPGLFSKESFLLLKISQPNSKQAVSAGEPSGSYNWGHFFTEYCMEWELLFSTDVSTVNRLQSL